MDRAGREVKLTEENGPATVVMTDMSTIFSLSSSSKRLMEDHGGLDFLLSLYTKLLSKLAEPYASVHQELRTIY